MSTGPTGREPLELREKCPEKEPFFCSGDIAVNRVPCSRSECQADRQRAPRASPGSAPVSRSSDSSRLEACFRGVSWRKSGGPLKLRDEREESAVDVMGRAGIADGRLRLAMQPLTQRKYQPRFANSGFAGNKGDLPASLLSLPPAREHKVEFLTAADERCQPCAVQRLEPAFGVAFPEDAPGPHRLGEALERGRREPRELEQIADEAPRAIGDDHRAGFGEPLQPRRQIRRLSRYPPLLRLARANKIADDHQPCGDSNARVERLAARLCRAARCS